MKISKKNHSTAMITTLIIVACGNSDPTLSQKQLREIYKQSQFVETDKTKDSSLFDFEKFQVNQLPDSWSQYFTGSGSTDWRVMNDAGNKVLAQLYSENPANHLPLFSMAKNYLKCRIAHSRIPEKLDFGQKQTP